MPGRSTGMTTLMVALLFLVLLIQPVPTETPALPHIANDAVAQGPLTCRGCAFSLDLVAWNGTGAPGSVLVGTFRIANTGETEDAYHLSATSDDPAWQATLDKDDTGTIPPGSGFFAEEDNETTFSLAVLVPPGAPALASTTVTVTATSRDMPEDREGRTKSETVTATARRIIAWALDCSEETEVSRGREADITFTAHNRGNDKNTATVEHVGSLNITTVDLPRFELAAGASDTQNGTIGASLRLEEGYHVSDWRLVDDRGIERATCDVGLVVNPVEQRPDGKESASPALLPVLLFVFTALAGVRRREA
ncbi:MAG: hypothetical protein KY455_05810 [Euryarchaeota archaeon]|nr:hypothetical protein [Euryarchaeota archaeon]